MRRNVWIAGLTILFTAGTLTMAPAFAFAAETLPQGIYAGELDLAGVPAEEAKETVSQYVEEKLDQEVVLVIDGNEALLVYAPLAPPYAPVQNVCDIAEATNIN